MRRVAAGLAVAIAALATPPAAGQPAVGRVARVEDAAPRGPSVDERLAEIRRRIQAALRYPPIARLRDAGGEARVRFEIGGDGRARDTRIAHSSGHHLLDAAALRAVVDAGVLPRVYGPLEVPVRFAIDSDR